MYDWWILFRQSGRKNISGQVYLGIQAAKCILANGLSAYPGKWAISGPWAWANGPVPWAQPMNQDTQKSRAYLGSIRSGYSRVKNVSGQVYLGIRAETPIRVRINYTGQDTIHQLFEGVCVNYHHLCPRRV